MSSNIKPIMRMILFAFILNIIGCSGKSRVASKKEIDSSVADQSLNYSEIEVSLKDDLLDNNVSVKQFADIYISSIKGEFDKSDSIEWLNKQDVKVLEEINRNYREVKFQSRFENPDYDIKR